VIPPPPPASGAASARPSASEQAYDDPASTCVDLVAMTVPQLNARAALIRASNLDAAMKQQQLADIQGEIDGRSHTDNVDQTTSETISNASAGNEAWNGSYGWQSKLHTYANQSTHTVVATVNLHTNATATEQAAWKKAVEDKWSGHMTMDVNPVAGTAAAIAHYAVRVVCNFVDDAKQADYEVTPNRPGDTANGRAGQGGTISMTGWGTQDTVDVTHEFGHMLGSPEEYFTTNGHDYTEGGKKSGFRDAGAGVMNNPSGPALERNYDLIRQSAARALGVDAKRCVIRR